MIKRALGIALLAACGLGSAAHAADLTVVEDVIVATPAFNWTGFYAGVHAGYGWANLDTTDTESYGGGKPDGFFGGGQVGYNYQFGNNVVLGIEADAAFADLKDDSSTHLPFSDDTFVDLGVSTKITALGTVRARAGYAVDRFLPYVTGGFAWANAKSSESINGNVDFIPNFNVSDSQFFTGWTVGAGVEYAVTNNITAKVEYLYADLGSKDFSFNYPGFDDSKLKGDLSSLQTVKLGLNYKF